MTCQTRMENMKPYTDENIVLLNLNIISKTVSVMLHDRFTLQSI